MRWIVKDSERKPDPEPMKGTATKAVVIGLIGFVLALIFILVFYNSITSPNKIWYPYTALVGIALGVFALFKVRGR